MKKILFLLLSGTLFVACVDNNYDLENVDTGNITIGGEESEFRIPLAKVYVTMDDLNENQPGENPTSIEKIFHEADTWLPTRLPGGETTVDLLKLQANTNGYTDGLLDALTAEMLDPRSDKITDVARLLCEEEYYDRFRRILKLPQGTTHEAFITTFVSAFRTQTTLRNELDSEVRTQASNYLTTIHVDPVNYDIGSIDIGSDVVDMLADNLDAQGSGGKNTLHLYGKIASELPVGLELAPQFTDTGVSFHVEVSAGSEASEIPPTQLFEEDLRQIIRGVSINMPVTLKTYSPGKGFQSSLEHQLVIDLRLVKHGGLKLDI